MTARDLPTSEELKKDFESARYRSARRKADILLEADYTNRGVICGAAHEHFIALARRDSAGRKKALRLAEMFSDCSFCYWLDNPA